MEDDLQFVTTVTEVLESTDFIRVLKVFSNASRFKNWLNDISDEDFLPKIFWIDLNLGDGNGIELIKQIRDKGLKTLCLVCSLQEDDEHIFEALKAGANGYILKNMSAAKMIEAVNELNTGGAPMSPFIANKVIRFFNKKRQAPDVLALLTEREKQVLEYLAKGLLYKEIANELAISIDTIKKHLSKIYTKLHVQNRSEAILKYLNNK